MAIACKHYKTPKENESLTDCQDYLYANEANSCFAIADGASQSFYPSIWAELLVDNFCQNPDINQVNWEKWLKPIQEKWSSEVIKRVEKAKSESKPTWVTNQNRLNSRVPATSTFIGLQFIENQVTVSIVGDSCLFIVKGHELKETHPLKESSAFNDRPEYFASYANHNEYSPKFFAIPLKHEESPEPLYFILATDALSEYIFKCVEHKETVFKDLLSITSQKEFESFVLQARNSSSIKMKNDDVALMILSVNDATTLEYLSPPKKTAKGYSEAVISEPLKRVNSNNGKNLEEQVRSLKQQRAIWGTLATVFLVFIFVDQVIPFHSKQQKNENSPNETNITSVPTFEHTTLTKGTDVYKKENPKQILVKSLSNSFEALFIKKDKDGTQFESTLYAPESIIKGNSCNTNKFEIQPNQNIKVSPNNETKPDDFTFGQLKTKTPFKKLEFKDKPGWCKFKLEGYIKR